jgi:hypothetical protein
MNLIGHYPQYLRGPVRHAFGGSLTKVLLAQTVLQVHYDHLLAD